LTEVSETKNDFVRPKRWLVFEAAKQQRLQFRLNKNYEDDTPSCPRL